MLPVGPTSYLLSSVILWYAHLHYMIEGLILHRHFYGGLEGFHWASGKGIGRPGERTRGNEKRGGRKVKRGGRKQEGKRRGREKGEVYPSSIWVQLKPHLRRRRYRKWRHRKSRDRKWRHNWQGRDPEGGGRVAPFDRKWRCETSPVVWKGYAHAQPEVAQYPP